MGLKVGNLESFRPLFLNLLDVFNALPANTIMKNLRVPILRLGQKLFWACEVVGGWELLISGPPLGVYHPQPQGLKLFNRLHIKNSSNRFQVGRVLKLFKSVGNRAIKLAYYKSFKALKISNRGLMIFWALTISKMGI